MQLTIWNIIGMFCAGAASVALGASIAGFLAYKIKYAGRELFHVERKPVAESFNIDSDFTVDEVVPHDSTRPENQREIVEGQAKFMEQFILDRIVGAGESKAEVEH